MSHEKLINAVKKIMESEMELGEMARKAYNNTLTEKGKTDITAAVKKMIADDKASGTTKNTDNFAFKALHFLAKQKVGEPVLTTDIQKAAGVKFPQPINKLLASLVASEYLERASSHVEPEPKEPGQRGRPKGEEKPKAEKAPKLGGLDLKKPAPKAAASTEDDVKNLAENEMNLDELEAELNESEESVNEESIESIAKSLVAKFGKDGSSEGGAEEVDEYKELHGGVGAEQGVEAEDALKDKDEAEVKEQLNESMLTMKFRAGLITDTQLANARKLLKK